MSVLIDDIANNIRESLTTFAENELEHDPDALSSQMVEALTKRLHQTLLESGRLGLENLIQRVRPAINVLVMVLNRTYILISRSLW